MKTEVLEYTCKVYESMMHLSLEHWLVGNYPLTYTPQECLEEFCDLVGWEFLKCRGGDQIVPIYTFHCRVSTDKLVMNTIYYWADYHRKRA